MRRDDPTMWQADWIAPSGQTIHAGEWCCFRRSFALADGLPTPRIRVACDSKYWLWIDGACVVYEGQLKRGPNRNGSYFDELTLSQPLERGEHTIAILVWYWGKHGFSHNSSSQSALLFELRDDSGIVSIKSDDQWRSIRHPAYGPGEEPFPNFRLAESNVAFDARAEPVDWQQSGFDDRAWPAAATLGTPPIGPWGELTPRPIPMWKDHGVRHLFSPARPVRSGGESFQFDLPHNLHAHPLFEIEAPPGLEIRVRTDNYQGGGAPNVRGTYITRTGRQSYESYGWMNGHRLHFDVPAGVLIYHLGYRQTSYDAQWLGQFNCNDDDLNVLYRKSCRTLDVCMRDNYMDCPDRERAQWWGDVVIQMGSAFYACDTANAPLLARKGIMELAAWQRDDHTLYSPIPAGIANSRFDEDDLASGCWDSELPAQMLASVGWYGFWTYYLYSGDREAIASVYPAVKRYLSVWSFDNARGLVDHRAGGWDWVDWGANVDVAVSINAWYALALRGANQMARLLDRPDDAAEYRQILRRLRVGFQHSFWKHDHFRGDESLPSPDDRAQAMAVLAGFVERRDEKAVVDVLRTQRHSGPYMEKYVIEALLVLGRTDLALARLKDRYAEQTHSELSTLWEGWSIGDATWGGGTYNHAWSGGAITLLQQHVAGITPITAGFDRFAVRPQLGPLRSIASSVPTRNGVIDVKIDLDAAVAQLNVPAGSIGEFWFGDRRDVFQEGRHHLKLQRPSPNERPLPRRRVHV